MHVKAEPLRQPGTNFGELVGAFIGHDQVELELLKNGLHDLAQKAQELLTQVGGLDWVDHLAGGHIQCRGQGVGAVTDGVMRHPFHIGQADRRKGVGAVHGA